VGIRGFKCANVYIVLVCAFKEGGAELMITVVGLKKNLPRFAILRFGETNEENALD